MVTLEETQGRLSMIIKRLMLAAASQEISKISSKPPETIERQEMTPLQGSEGKWP